MGTFADNKRDLTISVVIPAYNAAKFISRAIESVLAQTHRPDEIIVVDDGSTDNTAEKIKRFGSQVHYIYQENAGVSVARNNGIKAASSEWIAFLDADDEWLREKLDRQYELLGRNEHLVWVTANFYRCLCTENRRGCNVNPELAKKVLGSKEYFDDFFRTSLPHGCGYTGTMLIKKEILEQVGLFQVGMLHGEDMDLWWRIAYQWPAIGFNFEPLAVYHMNVSQSLTQQRLPHGVCIELIERHLKLSAEQGRDDVFKVTAGGSARARIRALLFENRPEEIRELMERFGELLTRRFKIVICLLLVSPRLTVIACHAISKIVRVLHLRTDIVRRPGQMRKPSRD